jgi:predicted ATPase/class 3 adenylate cyclase
VTTSPEESWNRRSRSVTFLFTDIEGSTRSWESNPERMALTLRRHDAIVWGAIRRAGGEVFKHTGDGVAAVFNDPSGAVLAAITIQFALLERLPEVRARAAVHTGRAEPRHGDWFGRAPNRAARLLAAGSGGQVLISSDALANATLPDGVVAEDMGRLRLRDVATPLEVCRLCHPDLPWARRPLRTLAAALTNLPSVSSSFVGRDEECALLAHMLDSARAVTLVGPGGVGKSRLALRHAEMQLEKYPDGVWFCELTSVEDPSHVAGFIANVLGVAGQGDTTEKELAAGLARKRCLLVLDNCEHLVSSLGGLVGRLQLACPMTSVLVTSRVALGFDGEQTHVVPPLDHGTPDSPAVRLFSDRVRAGREDFVVDAQNRGVVLSICRHLDGLPLAIELAASRARSMALVDIDRRLDERFRLLRGVRADVVGRQRSLEAVVQWSYNSCEPAARKVFDRLSVFANGATLTAVEQICAGDGVSRAEVADHLSSLVEHSIVVADVSHDETTYSMLETLRAFGRDRLQETDHHEQWSRRHAGYMLDVARKLEVDLRGRSEEKAGTQLLASLDNLRVAMTWSASQADLDLAMGIASANAYLAYEMQRFEALGWCESALELDGASGHRLFPAVAGILALGRGQLRDWQGGIDLATTAIETAASDDAEESPWPHLARVQIALWSGRLLDASLWVDEFVEACTRLDDLWGVARALGLRAWVLALIDPDRAADAAEQAVEAATTSGNPSVRSFVHWDEAQVLLHSGDLTAALAAVQRGGRLAEPTANVVAKGVARQLEMALRDLLGDAKGRWRCARDAIELLAIEGTVTTLAGITMLQIVEGLARAGRTDAARLVISASSPEERVLISTLEAELPEVVAVLRSDQEPDPTLSDAEVYTRVMDEIEEIIAELDVSASAAQ